MTRSYLHAGDYAVFGISMFTSLAIGLYHGWKNRKKQTTEAFLMANRNMGWVPISLSLYVGWFSALSVLGDPTEAYYFGTAYIYVAVGHCLCLITTLYFAPRYRDLKLTSAYEFLELRFGKLLRYLGSFIFTVANIIYLAVALYAPAIGVSQMSGLDLNLCICGIGIICMVYTSLGGMKAVLWVDTLQCFVMMGGLIVVLICGVNQVGGIQKVLDLSVRSGRNTLNSFDPDPRLRASFFIYLLGGYFRAFKSYIGEQIYVQRYCIAKSNKTLIVVILVQIPLIILTMVLFALIGITMSAYFYGCDPLQQGIIEKKDQLLPYFVLRTMGFMPGLSGLFMAAFVSAALSTMSSQHNSLVTLILKDFILPLHEKIKGRVLADRVAMFLSIALALLVGTINILMALPVPKLQDMGVFGLSSVVTGAMKGPISALFALAICCKFVDYPSALIAFFLGNGISIWLGIGSMIWPSSYHGGFIGQEFSCNTSANSVHMYDQPFSTDMTNSSYTVNSTSLSLTEISFALNDTNQRPSEGFLYHIDKKFVITDFFKFSPIFYAATSITLTLVIGIISGAISSCIKKLFKKKESGQQEEYTLVKKSSSSYESSPQNDVSFEIKKA